MEREAKDIFKAIKTEMDFNKSLTSTLENMFGKGTTWKWGNKEKGELQVFIPPKPIEFINVTIEVGDGEKH